MQIMIFLVGEQPAPNLLPIRRYKPDVVVLAYTSRTEAVYQNLANIIRSQVEPLPVDPYNMIGVADSIEQLISDKKWSAKTITFNITGGTKPMALAAFNVAQKLQSSLLYFQTEGQKSLVYRYHFTEKGELKSSGDPDEIPETICLDDYLKVYLGQYRFDPPRDVLEEVVFQTLFAESRIDEVMTSVRPGKLDNVEIDMVLRCKNQIGIVEVKRTGKKDGVDQLTAVAEQRHLGTYIAKFLISTKPFHPHQKQLAKAYRLELIELPSYSEKTGSINQEDTETLTHTILKRMGVI